MPTVGGPPPAPRRADSLPVPANLRVLGPPVVAHRAGEAGTTVLYRCKACDLVVPYWGSLHGMQRRKVKWPRALACLEIACAGQLHPEDARRTGHEDFRVLLRLVEQRELRAAMKWWNQLPEVRLEALDWGPPRLDKPPPPPPPAPARKEDGGP